jgi:DNA polymerase-1
MKKVLFLDGYNLIYRALSGFTKGEHYVIYNFFRGLRPLVEKFNPDLVYFVLEGDPKHRKALSKGDYKSNRKSKGDHFHLQKASIIQAVKEFLPFITIRHPDFECDDVIATMVMKHAASGDECFIISSDSDFIQLHNVCKVTLYNPIKKTEIPKPDYDYVMWKALRGDPTDNIKGIPKVGDKTADKLIKDPVLLKEFLSDKSKKEIFDRNVNLIRLVDLRNAEDEMEIISNQLNEQGLRDYFGRLEFDSMIKEKTWQKYIKTFKEVTNESSAI